MPPVKQPLNLKSNTLQLSHCTPFVLFYFHLLCQADKINVSLRPKLVITTNYRLMQVKSIAECLEHSAILSTFIKLPFVIKIFVLSIFEWPFYTCFTV